MKEKIYIPIKIDEIVVSNEITKEIENSKDKKALLEIVGVDFTSINIEKQEEVLIQINKLLKKYKIEIDGKQVSFKASAAIPNSR